MKQVLNKLYNHIFYCDCIAKVIYLQFDPTLISWYDIYMSKTKLITDSGFILDDKQFYEFVCLSVLSL